MVHFVQLRLAAVRAADVGLACNYTSFAKWRIKQRRTEILTPTTGKRGPKKVEMQGETSDVLLRIILYIAKQYQPRPVEDTPAQACRLHPADPHRTSYHPGWAHPQQPAEP